MFGYPEAMKWTFDPASGLTIQLPDGLHAAERRPNQYAWGLGNLDLMRCRSLACAGLRSYTAAGTYRFELLTLSLHAF